MIFTPLSIEGALEIALNRLGDERGFFGRVYCEREFAEQGLNTRWAQSNVSYTQDKGTVRGLHFQRPPASEVKMVRVLRGRVLDVFVDLRTGSPSYKQHCALELSAEAKNAVYIPTGCAHGFQTLTGDVELYYSHSHPYAPEHEDGIHPLDPELGLEWPLPIARLSPRDQDLSPLADCEPMQ